MNAKNALSILGITRPFLQTLVKEGKIRTVKIEEGKRFSYDYNDEDIERIFKERESVGHRRRFDAIYSLEDLENNSIGYEAIIEEVSKTDRRSSSPRFFIDYKNTYFGSRLAFKDLLKYIYKNKVEFLYVFDENFCFDFEETKAEFLECGTKIVTLSDLQRKSL